MVGLPRQRTACTCSRSLGVFFRSLKEASGAAQVGQHWRCAGDTEIWYHQLGRVDPPPPPAAAPYAADYAAKERHGPDGGASNDRKTNLTSTEPSRGPVAVAPSIIRWPRQSGSYENKEFMRYSKMDVLDFSYLFDTPMDAVLLNLGVHSYVLDPHVSHQAAPPRFLCPADSVLCAGLRSDGGADPARG